MVRAMRQVLVIERRLVREKDSVCTLVSNGFIRFCGLPVLPIAVSNIDFTRNVCHLHYIVVTVEKRKRTDASDDVSGLDASGCQGCDPYQP